MSGESSELRGPLLHKVSNKKRTSILEGLLSPERVPCQEGLLFLEEVMQV